MFQARQQASDTVHDAASKLLLVLEPAQKARADKTLPGLAFRPGVMGQR
jgi:hypothetical protein